MAAIPTSLSQGRAVSQRDQQSAPKLEHVMSDYANWGHHPGLALFGGFLPTLARCAHRLRGSEVPAKKKRFGKDPFSGEERWFAPKPASIKIRTRALKKLKGAAL
jgi:hypothetical protein